MVQIKRTWVVFAGSVVLLLVALLAVSHLLNADTYRGQIESALSESLGRKVQLGHLSFSLFSGSLVATAPSIADDPTFTNQPFLTAKDIHIGVDTAAYLFHKELHITGFTIHEPQINLLRKENGIWNYSSLGGQKPTKPAATSNSFLPNLTVTGLSIQGGALTVGSIPQRGPTHVWSQLNVDARNFSFANPFPFTASGKLPDGGAVEISGNAGPINQRDASLSPITAQLSLKHADLLSAGLVEPEQGVSGIADLESKIVSNGQNAQLDGKLHVTQLKLAKNGTPSSQPVDVQFSIVQDLQALSGKIASANIQVGHASINLAGTYEAKGITTVQMRATGDNMPIDEFMAFLPSLGVQLPAGSRLHGGTLTTALDINGPLNAPVLSGPVRVAGTQLAGFDLGKKLASVEALTGARTGGDTTIQALSTNLRYGAQGTRLDDLSAVVSGLGSAAGNGEISPGGGLNFHLTVKLDSSGVGGIATQALGMLPGMLGPTVSQTTRSGIPVTISGTTSNPVFTPDMGRVVGGAIQKNQPANSLGNVLGGLLHR